MALDGCIVLNQDKLKDLTHFLSKFGGKVGYALSDMSFSVNKKNI
jgi:hypothetical protein